MEVITTADRSLDKAKEGVTLAIEALTEVIVKECDGYDSFTPEYTQRINIFYGDLVEAYRKFRLKKEES